ncbi:hypothetical protein J6590_045954 [Homalodisca vitripennis]|nr:hypothetical protein J6590_045954 [Homalodisca vitripennis]
MDDHDEDVFSDTISEHSIRSKGDYINLSRFTIYHSAQDLEEKMAEEDRYTDKSSQLLHTTDKGSSPHSPKPPHKLHEKNSMKKNSMKKNSIKKDSMKKNSMRRISWVLTEWVEFTW